MRSIIYAFLIGCFLCVIPRFASAQEMGSAENALSAVETGGERPRWFLSGEYLVWWLREGRVPPLLTTSSFASRGLLGQPDTQVLYGDGRLETRHGDRFFGGRVTLEGWFGDGAWGVEGRAFFLERDSTHFKAISDGNTLLARPFFNAATGMADSEVFAGPAADGLCTGQFVGYSRIELFGEEANLVRPLIEGDGSRLDLLAGARFLQMRDRLDLTATSRVLPTQATLHGLDDHWRAHDAYYGGQLGLRGEVNRGRWSLGLRGTAGLGGDDQQVRPFGDRIFHTPAGRVETSSSLAVQPSNTGNFHRGELDFVAEAGVNVAYRLTDHWRAFVGYTFLYWNNPVRAGDQVDLTINPVQPSPGPARPTVPFKEDSFWAQGISGGLELRW
jgi:hypothetical protein